MSDNCDPDELKQVLTEARKVLEKELEDAKDGAIGSVHFFVQSDCYDDKYCEISAGIEYFRNEEEQENWNPYSYGITLWEDEVKTLNDYCVAEEITRLGLDDGYSDEWAWERL